MVYWYKYDGIIPKHCSGLPNASGNPFKPDDMIYVKPSVQYNILLNRYWQLLVLVRFMLAMAEIEIQLYI